ncbi:MAG: hypothetical protein KBF75_04940 [Saprospiraceae bacterium]|nr:hypothetical protein [Saprospiraceae bacterium]
MKNKYDFIQEILESKKLNPAQRERVLLLALQEFKSENDKDEVLIKRIEEIEGKLNEIKSINFPNNELATSDNNSQNKKNELTHNPRLVSQYLEKFKENTALKWATHIWDEKKYETISLFIQDINADKGYIELFNVQRDLYNLLNYFLYTPKVELNENGVPKYGWPNFQDMKIGWQFPNNLLINWCKENFDNKDESDIKYPFQYNLPKELQPQKPIKGSIVTTFENVVDIFKTEIQFRESYFYKELKKKNNKIADYKFEGIENFKNLDFYTYTNGFLSAIDTVLVEIKKNETEKKILFSYEMQENELIIDIVHVNSFPTRKLNTNNLVQFLGGGMNAISGSIFSLCDFSIVSRFIDEKNNEIHGELCIVYYGIKGNISGKELSIIGTPRLQAYDKEINGFTYRFKFFL